MKIRFTAEVIQGLDRLRTFVEAKNPHAARRMAAELLDGVGNLALFPDIGLPVNRAPDPKQIRDLFVGNYTIRYLRADNSITVLRIWHDKEAREDNT